MNGLINGTKNNDAVCLINMLVFIFPVKFINHSELSFHITQSLQSFFNIKCKHNRIINKGKDWTQMKYKCDPMFSLIDWLLRSAVRAANSLISHLNRKLHAKHGVPVYTHTSSQNEVSNHIGYIWLFQVGCLLFRVCLCWCLHVSQHAWRQQKRSHSFAPTTRSQLAIVSPSQSLSEKQRQNGGMRTARSAQYAKCTICHS